MPHTLTLSDDGALQLPAELIEAKAWRVGQRFSLEVHHGVLVINALSEAPEPSASAPRDPDALIALRIRLGLTRSVMAKRVGVTPELVRAWEEGQAQPSEAELARLTLLASDE